MILHDSIMLLTKSKNFEYFYVFIQKYAEKPSDFSSDDRNSVDIVPN